MGMQTPELHCPQLLQEVVKCKASGFTRILGALEHPYFPPDVAAWTNFRPKFKSQPLQESDRIECRILVYSVPSWNEPAEIPAQAAGLSR